jgi:hypothetical protein
MLVISGFAIAGLFSSRVFLESNFVLVSGDSCAIWNYNLTGQASHLNTSAINSTADLANQAYFVYAKDQALSSLHYARSCYIGGVESDTGSGTCRSTGRQVLDLALSILAFAPSQEMDHWCWRPLSILQKI